VDRNNSQYRPGHWHDQPTKNALLVRAVDDHGITELRWFAEARSPSDDPVSGPAREHAYVHDRARSELGRFSADASLMPDWLNTAVLDDSVNAPEPPRQPGGAPPGAIDTPLGTTEGPCSVPTVI
jgi:hypothetical protein